MIDAVILGASGYGGGELLRLLSGHPQLGRVQALSRSHVGKPLQQQHPTLRNALGNQVFQAEADWHSLASSAMPVCFAALPHGEFARQYEGLLEQWQRAGLAQRLLVIDLSGDFRLRDADEFARAYHGPHPCPQHLGDFVYGLSEFAGATLAGCRRIANPGCFATALELGLLPLADLPREARPDDVYISAVTGSSGSGATPAAGTHHPLRAHDFRAYKMLTHQHEAEVMQLLREAGWGARFAFVPHSAPLVRGIHATLMFRLQGVDEQTLRNTYAQRYPEGGFVRMSAQPPRLAAVVGSNDVDIHLAVQHDQVCVLVALDNLVKGMAGQAIQNMNLALGLEQRLGLNQLALWPG